MPSTTMVQPMTSTSISPFSESPDSSPLRRPTLSIVSFRRTGRTTTFVSP